MGATEKRRLKEDVLSEFTDNIFSRKLGQRYDGILASRPIMQGRRPIKAFSKGYQLDRIQVS